MVALVTGSAEPADFGRFLVIVVMSIGGLSTALFAGFALDQAASDCARQSHMSPARPRIAITPARLWCFNHDAPPRRTGRTSLASAVAQQRL
jgi:hypothetical protein